MIVTLLITIGAPLAIITFIIYSDKFKEPLDLILKTFVLGIFLCIPAGLLNDLLIQSPDQSYFAGLTEESLKFIVLYFYIRPKTAFNEPMDAIVYGTIASLGFATLENLTYVYSGSPESGFFYYRNHKSDKCNTITCLLRNYHGILFWPICFSGLQNSFD